MHTLRNIQSGLKVRVGIYIGLAIAVVLGSWYGWKAYESQKLPRELFEDHPTIFIQPHLSSLGLPDVTQFIWKHLGVPEDEKALYRAGNGLVAKEAKAFTDARRKYGKRFRFWLAAYDIPSYRSGGIYDMTSYSWRYSGRSRKGPAGDKEYELLWLAKFWFDTELAKEKFPSERLPSFNLNITAEIKDLSGFTLSRVDATHPFITTGEEPQAFGIENQVSGNAWIPEVSVRKTSAIEFTWQGKAGNE